MENRNATQNSHTVAFALGGLAGNNAHGAGFLQAALDHDVNPVMISCTSGQIRWVHHYLTALENRSRGSTTNALRTVMAEEVAALKTTGNINTDVALLGLFGKAKIFHPAYEYLVPDLMRNAGDVIARLIHNKGNVLLADQLLSLMPGRVLVPDFDETFFATISDAFNHAPMGIAFNAYNPSQGVEYVYLNPAAMKLLDKQVTENLQEGAHKEHRPYRFYKPIDGAAVRNALWLYQYGFFEDENQFVDGAYFRDMLLAELVVADTIFSVRPINHKWLGGLPHSYQAMEDLKTEVGFNGVYAAERDQITLINKMLEKGVFGPEKSAQYHPIELIELEMGTQRGYFDYMLESQAVFDAAASKAGDKFVETRKAGKL